jgi:hypothetical protein
MDSVVGVLLGLAGDTALLLSRLLVYTEATKRQLIGGGSIGVLIGLILGLTLSLGTGWVILAAVVAVGSIASFNGIVNGEINFTGRIFVLYLLPFLITLSLGLLGTKASQLLRSRGQAKTAED